jgi:hypothetical protein
MCKQVHSHSVDYFALGVIGYEFMLGRVHTNLFRDPMLEIVEMKSERLFWQSRCR